MNHVGEVEFKDVANGFLYCGMITADVENAVAAEEVEVVLAVEVVEIGAFSAGIDFIKADRSLNFDERTVDVLIVKLVILPQTSENCVFEIEFGHGSYK